MDDNVEKLQPIVERPAARYPIQIVWSKACDDFLNSKRIFTRHVMQQGHYQPGNRVFITQRVLLEPEATLPLGRFCTMGAFSYFSSWFDGAATVGRYSSIAKNCGVMGDSHPTSWLTTHPLPWYPPFAGVARDHYQIDLQQEPYEARPHPVTIGNDVWIGQNVLFKGGITIGDGAVVAAGSIVTKDVEPYAIVGGGPAKLIKYRFPEDLRHRLIQSKWWEYNLLELPPAWSDPARLLDLLEEKKSLGQIELWKLEQIDIAPALLEASLKSPDAS